MSREIKLTRNLTTPKSGKAAQDTVPSLGGEGGRNLKLERSEFIDAAAVDDNLECAAAVCF
eukprot:380570-Rhodomonas_salina.1